MLQAYKELGEEGAKQLTATIQQFQPKPPEIHSPQEPLEVAQDMEQTPEVSEKEINEKFIRDHLDSITSQVRVFLNSIHMKPKMTQEEINKFNVKNEHYILKFTIDENIYSARQKFKYSYEVEVTVKYNGDSKTTKNILLSHEGMGVAEKGLEYSIDYFTSELKRELQ